MPNINASVDEKRNEKQSYGRYCYIIWPQSDTLLRVDYCTEYAVYKWKMIELQKICLVYILR